MHSTCLHDIHALHSLVNQPLRLLPSPMCMLFVKIWLVHLTCAIHMYIKVVMSDNTYIHMYIHTWHTSLIRAAVGLLYTLVCVQTHIVRVVVELVGDDSEFGEFESSRDLLGFVSRVCAVPHKLVQPDRGGGRGVRGER